MNAQHYRSAYWIQQGVFDGLRQFSEFEARVNAVHGEKDRGDIFEIFVEAFLATQSITQSVQHRVVGNIPLELRERYRLPSGGTGIDGIYQIHDGTHVAYQVKYRRKSHLTFTEVAPFLGITEEFPDRVIFTNAASLAGIAAARTRWFSSEVFHDLSAGALKQIECWLKQRPLPTIRATPDPSYQTQALADIAQALASEDRATAVMACGTGKTLIALWAAEQAQPKTVLVLVPSLTLLQQTLKEWSEHTSWGPRFSYLCVCSDQTVDLKNDELNIDTADVGFRVDTDPDVVRSFLSRATDDVKVIFSTYHSSPVVAAGAKGLSAFDFAVFDEAHKTTGRSGTAFSHALDDCNIRIRKRLFLTATPRHIDIRHRDKEGEFRVQSMDDTSVYGPRAHTLTFRAAADKGVICPYKVLISVIDKQMVDDFALKNGITLVAGDEMAARWVAHLVALEQGAKLVDAKKIISFHSRVAIAQEFASDSPRGVAHYLQEYRVDHVNGRQNTADRRDIIRAFADASHALLTNARCLTEGVNIPAVDMVAFIDPRQSRVDIAQAVGRAMRKPRGATTKTLGYVLVPLFCGIDGESVEDAIHSERFDGVAGVLNALQENDEELVDIIREIKQRRGEGRPFNPKRFLDKIEVIGPQVDFARLTQSIAIEIADRIGASWDEWYGRLVDYKQREGHCQVTKRFRTADGYSLGVWAQNQRATRDILLPERRQRLDELGFPWEPREQNWEAGLTYLRAYKEEHNNCLVPRTYKTEEGFNLGLWVNSQQSAGKDWLSSERRRQLDELGIVWDRYEQKWEEGFARLQAYREDNSDCLVPRSYRTSDGFRLGSWVSTQRNGKDLSPERRRRLDQLGFAWDPGEQQWEEGFGHLQAYREDNGHCRVPQHFRTAEGYPLGVWVSNLRASKDRLPQERRGRLDGLGFVWDPLEVQWKEGFAHLQAYREDNSDCLVPRSYRTSDGFRLGIWVSNQRNGKDLSPERRRRLDGLGFVWDPFEQQWEEGFAHLQVYKEDNPDCRVPGGFITEDGFKLGFWASHQRTNKNTISADRRRRLDELGFVWDPLEQQWEEGYGRLVAYKQREGHCQVPKRFKTEDGYRLGYWTQSQRNGRDALSPDRHRRLDELGIVWDPLEQHWEEAFDRLRAYKEHNGDCLVPQKFKTRDGFRLGFWVGTQRRVRDTLPEERRRRLDELGFLWTAKSRPK